MSKGWRLDDDEYKKLIYAGITIEEYLIQKNKEFQKWLRHRKKLSKNKSSLIPNW